MIPKLLKEKSQKKYVNKLLANQNVKINSKKIKSIGVLFNKNDFDDFSNFERFLSTFDLEKYTIISFTSEKQKPSGNYINSKDFGWFGKLHNETLKTFAAYHFDVLISYYDQSSPYLDVLTAVSKANLKVGLSETNQELYNLIINMHTSDFEVFKIELVKYLEILKKV